MKLMYSMGVLMLFLLSGFTVTWFMFDARSETSHEPKPSTGLVHVLGDDVGGKKKRTQQAPSLFRQVAPEHNHMFIAHALGSVDGVAETNSKEAFVETYRNGFRLFEADMSQTKDGKVAIFHHRARHHIGMSAGIDEVNLGDFLSHKSFEKFTLLSLEDLLELMRVYPDMYLITDVKSDITYAVSQILESDAVKAQPEIVQRIIPQIYHPEELATVLSLYPFSDIIFTLYKTPLTNDEVVLFVSEHPEITAVTMSAQMRYTDNIYNKLKKLGVQMFVHTINDEKKIQEFITKGVGVYTDNTTEKVLQR